MQVKVSHNNLRPFKYASSPPFLPPFWRKTMRRKSTGKLIEMIYSDEFGLVYNRYSYSSVGSPAIPSRITIGAQIFEYLKRLSVEEVIKEICENPYFQYFQRFEKFLYRTVFVPCLFLEIHKRHDVM
jgi:hypothetical protein